MGPVNSEPKGRTQLPSGPDGGSPHRRSHSRPLQRRTAPKPAHGAVAGSRGGIAGCAWKILSARSQWAHPTLGLAVRAVDADARGSSAAAQAEPVTTDVCVFAHRLVQAPLPLLPLGRPDPAPRQTDAVGSAQLGQEG